MRDMRNAVACNVAATLFANKRPCAPTCGIHFKLLKAM
jgi:hypothetical protein